jgi:hypothetical protein
MNTWRNTFILLGVALIAVVVAVLAAYEGTAEASRDRDMVEKRALAASEKASAAEARLGALERSMPPVTRFLEAWRPHLRPFAQERDLAVAMRTALESVAQRKLSLITDQATTPEPAKLSLAGRSLQAQRISLRASGENLPALLSWLGEAEAMFPYARLEHWELSATGVSNSALRITLAQPLASAEPRPGSP